MTWGTEILGQIASIIPFNPSGRPQRVDEKAPGPSPSNSSAAVLDAGIEASSIPVALASKVSVSTQTEEKIVKFTAASASADPPAPLREIGPLSYRCKVKEPLDYTAFDSDVDLTSAEADVPFEVLDDLLEDTLTTTKPIRTADSSSTNFMAIEVYPAHDKALAFHYLRLVAKRGVFDVPAHREHNSGYALYPEDVDRLLTCGYVNHSEIDFTLGAAMLGVGALRRVMDEAGGQGRTGVPWTLSPFERLPTTRDIARYIEKQEKERTVRQAQTKANAYTVQPNQRPELSEDWVRKRTEEHGWYGLNGERWNEARINDAVALELIKRRDVTYYIPPAANISTPLPPVISILVPGGINTQLDIAEAGPASPSHSPSRASLELGRGRVRLAVESIKRRRRRSTGNSDLPGTRRSPDILSFGGPRPRYSSEPPPVRRDRRYSTSGPTQLAAPTRSSSAFQLKPVEVDLPTAAQSASEMVSPHGDVLLKSFGEEPPTLHLDAKGDELPGAEAVSSTEHISAQRSTELPTSKDATNEIVGGPGVESEPFPGEGGGKGKRKRGEEEDIHDTTIFKQEPNESVPPSPSKRRRISLVHPAETSTTSAPHGVPVPRPSSTPSLGKGSQGRGGNGSQGSANSDTVRDEDEDAARAPSKARLPTPSSSKLLEASSSSISEPSSAQPPPTPADAEKIPRPNVPALRRSKRIATKRTSAHR